MKIALFGASGMIGQRVAQEALRRGHEVTAIVRDPARIQFRHPQLTLTEGNALNPESVTQVVAGHDVVVSATKPSENQPLSALAEAAQSLLEGVKRAGVKRLLVVGGAGTMEVAPGVRALDVFTIPEEWKPEVMAKLEEWEVYRKNSDVDWTYFSPPVFLEPGERTGTYRLGIDQLVMNAQGESRISAEDYAVALLDEIEQPRFVRQRFSAAGLSAILPRWRESERRCTLQPQSPIDQQQPRLPTDTHMEPASLTLADLDRSGTCSSTVIGLAMLERTEQTAVLGTRNGQALLTLVQQKDARPQLPYTTGLYHIPILLPSWVDLALHAGMKPPVSEV